MYFRIELGALIVEFYVFLFINCIYLLFLLASSGDLGEPILGLSPKKKSLIRGETQVCGWRGLNEQIVAVYHKARQQRRTPERLVLNFSVYSLTYVFRFMSF